MDKTFCKGCDFKDRQLPQCVAYKIATMISLDDFIEGNYTHKELYPICYKNAQSINDSKLVISDECDCCYMCSVACPELSIDNSLVLECNDKIILKNLNLTNIALNLLLNIPVASEVKTEGNCRQKRIDISVKNGNNLYLIKVLHSAGKIDFYNRSYEEVAMKYNKQYVDMNVQVAFLLPEEIYLNVKDKTEFNFFTMRNIYEYFRGE